MTNPVEAAPRRRPRHRTERRFGLSVGGVLLALGAWALFRGRSPAAWGALLAIGGALVALGALAPRLLVVPNRLWMRLAEGLGFVMSRVVLGVVFFLLLTPLSLVRRVLGSDPLRRRSGSRESYWVDYPPRHRDPNHYEKLF